MVWVMELGETVEGSFDFGGGSVGGDLEGFVVGDGGAGGGVESSMTVGEERN